jgi:hypothetical protein
MTLRLFLHDNTPAKEGEPHGEDGPTHAGTVQVDYEYQIETWVFDEIQSDYPRIIRARCPELSREWKRGSDGKFAEIEGSHPSGQKIVPELFVIVPPVK